MLILLLAALQATPAKIVNDDRDVIQAALLLSIAAQPKPSKTSVYLGLQLSKGIGQEFESDVTASLRQVNDELYYWDTDWRNSTSPRSSRERQEQATKVRDLKNDMSTLRAIQAAKYAKTYSPPGIVPLKAMAWDPRIVVTDRRAYLRPLSDSYAWNVSVAKPHYSPDGQFAFVITSGAVFHPWTDRVLMKRTPKGWVYILDSLTTWC